MSSELTEILSLMEFAAQRGLSHFVQDDGKTRIALTRASGAGAGAAAAPPLSALSAPALPLVAEAPAILAPMPGICHLSPNPGSPPFVTEGSRVEAGQTLCILEAMKMMTAIPAPHAGTVIKIHATAGSSIATGDRLLEIEA